MHCGFRAKKDSTDAIYRFIVSAVVHGFRHSILGRLDGDDGPGFRPLGVGHDFVPHGPFHGAWEGRACIGVRDVQPRANRTDIIGLSLWTKYTVAGKRCSVSFYACSHLTISSAIPGSLAFTMGFLPLYMIIAPAIGFSTEYLNIVPRLWSDPILWFSIIVFPAVCLTRDYVWK